MNARPTPDAILTHAEPEVAGAAESATGLKTAGPETGSGAEPASAGRGTPWWRRATLGAALAYLLGALWVTARGWVDPFGRLLGSRPHDQGFNEWMLAYAARATSRLENPFFTTLQNAPDGVNLMTNIGNQLVGALLTPVTLLGGPALSYLIYITLNLAATGFAWYWVLSRHLVASRAAAFVGGLFCAFAPAMISHSNGHPHITAQWLVPFIVWRVVLLTRAGSPVRNGLVLGALVSAQFFIGLEILFLTAIGCAMALVGYVILRPRAARERIGSALATLGIAGAMVLVVAAYPLWMQFFGPQHRIGHPGDPDTYALKLNAFFGYATESIAGGPGSTKGLTANTTEESAFYGWPLLVLAAAVVLWLRRDLAVRLLAGTAVLSGIFALGSTVGWGQRRTGIPTPFVLFQHLPVFDSVVVARFALITTAALGLLLAIAGDRLMALTPGARSAGVPLRLLAGATAVAALLPVLPTPLPAQARPPVPEFVTSGHWRDHVADGRTLVPVPVQDMGVIYWGIAAGTGFAVPQGYFLGPTSETDATGRWGAAPRPTSVLLLDVATGKRGPEITPAERDQALADVRYWKADALALPKQRHEAELKAVLDACFGPARRVDDVWLWDVRPLTTT